MFDTAVTAQVWSSGRSRMWHATIVANAILFHPTTCIIAGNRPQGRRGWRVIPRHPSVAITRPYKPSHAAHRPPSNHEVDEPVLFRDQGLWLLLTRGEGLPSSEAPRTVSFIRARSSWKVGAFYWRYATFPVAPHLCTSLNTPCRDPHACSEKCFFG